METEKTFTVSEITRQIKLVLEGTFERVLIQGEVSNFTRHSSGHFYFSLKDELAQINAVMWRGKTHGLNFIPQNGMEILAAGRIIVFEKGGRYQIDTDMIQPLGVGDLQIAFEELKAKLRDEGLFNSEYKKPIPFFPERIGVVTSPTGAAIKDLKSVIQRRFPGVTIILRPALVQGEGAAADIAKAIEEFNEYGEVDVLIVGRGGGSLEDLWAFNEEIVARAIFKSGIPIISAVGHEIDFTIADFVADVRAPTPSAAGEIVVQNAADVLETVKSRIRNIYTTILNKILYLNEKVKSIEKSRGFYTPLERLNNLKLKIDTLDLSLDKIYQEKVQRNLDYVEQLSKRLESLAPEAVLKRGYSIVYKEPEGGIVTDSAQLKDGDLTVLKFFKGKAEGRIEKIIK
ncbi:MAG: exodeoxyribonuclease VII large subunit [bacterium]|nr:exodeoxyribonuclease VII large subunit [bacterium]